MKTCNRCGQRKPDDKFHRVFSNGRFYLHGYCKLCQRILARERWRRLNTAACTPVQTAEGIPARTGAGAVRRTLIAGAGAARTVAGSDFPAAQERPA